MKIRFSTLATLALGALLGLSVSGCTWSTLRVHTQVPSGVMPVTATVVNIKPTSSCDEDVFDEWEEDFENMVRLGLRKRRVEMLERGTEDALIAVGAVTYMNPGKRWLRGLVGFGAGAGSIESEWTLYDREEQVVGKASISSSVTGGFAGGSYANAMLEIGLELGVFLRGARVGEH